MDPEARFRAVFDRAYAPLCRYARHRGLSGADAEDLVAQTLEIAWRRLDERAALASLSDADQEVLRLVAWDGLTPAEVAVVLGCNPVAARSRLHRARGRLAAVLGLDAGVQRRAPA